MKIILKELNIHNFQKIKEAKINFNCLRHEISGDNGCGKTTIYSAYCWLMFDKNNTGQSQFDIKYIKRNGEVLHNLSHSVEARFTPDLTLKKEYKEKWTKPRGQAIPVLGGHEFNYYINNVPVSKTEYTSRISSICAEELFRSLSDPSFFVSKLHWKLRRDMLLKMFGNVADEEVIATDDRLKDLDLSTPLNAKRKIISTELLKINKELDYIPIRIDEAIKNTPDISDINEPEIRKEIKNMEETYHVLNNVNSISNLEDNIKELRLKYIELYNQKNPDKCHTCGQTITPDIKNTFNIKKNENLKKIREQGQILTKKIEQIKNAVSSANKNQNANKIKKIIEEKAHKLYLIDTHRKLQDRVLDLQDEQKKLANRSQGLQKQLFLIDEFIRAKIKLITDKINNAFELVCFRLFDEQTNGNIVECCDATYGGVPYDSRNTASKVQIGLIIINTLQSYYDIQLPVFIDNVESVNVIPAIDCQLITLKVANNPETIGTGDRIIMHEE